MLHLCDKHFVTSLHLRFTERRCHQINGFRRTTRKHYLFYLSGIDKLAHLFTSSLMQIGSLLRKIVNATMHIGIHVQVFVTHGIEHTEWFLRGSSIVEVYQRFTINLS